MANININNLSGSDSFNNSESFLIDITDDAENILGGGLKERIVRAIRAIIDIFDPSSESTYDRDGLLDPDGNPA